MDSYTFADIVDLSAVQNLLESHYAISGIMVTILDPEGNELAGVGWQDLCRRFHHQHPDSIQLCRIFDHGIHEMLAGRDHGETFYHECVCENGLMSIAVPVLIEGRSLATLFTGQFLYQPPDEEEFRRRARRFGFNESDYLDALRRVPVLSREQVKANISFLTRFVMLLSQMGVDRLHRLETQKQLAESDTKFRTLFENSNDGIFLLHPEGRALEINPAGAMRLGYSREELLSMDVSEVLSPKALKQFGRRMQEVKKRGSLVYESEHVRKDGSIYPVEISVRTLEYRGSQAVLATVRDITERQERERVLRYREAFEALIADVSSRFVALPAIDAELGIDYVLERLGTFTGVERIGFFAYDADQRTASCTHEWCAPGVRSNKGSLQRIAADQVPWAAEKLLSQQLLHVPEVDHVPAEAAPEQALWQANGVRSTLMIPIVAGGQVRACFSLSMLSGEKSWHERDMSMLRTIGELVGNALERKVAAETLRQSEERFRSFFEHAAAGVGILSPDKVFLAVNEAHARMFGYQVDELIGFNMLDLTHPDDRERTVAQYRKLEEGKIHSIVYEKRYIRKDGSIAWGFTSVAPVYGGSGNLLHYLCLFQDITERKSAETALLIALSEAEESREQIEAILTSVGDVLLVTDLNGKVVLMNRRAEEVLRVSRSDAIGKPVEAIADHAVLLDRINAVLDDNAESTPGDLELPADHPDSSLVFEVRSDAVVSRRGPKTGVISILRDVTRERELDRMKNEFISTAAHELRTPLTSVLGFSQVLLNAGEYDLVDSGRQRELIEHIYSKALSLKVIIDDLLDLSRVQSGRVISLNYQPGDICSLLRDIVASYRQSAPEHSFELEVPDPCPLFLMDSKKLTQVMENLLSNAAKFSMKWTPIRVMGGVVDEFFQVSVADQGIGMTPVQVERVFDKFYRADASDSAAEGLGLGMAIVKNIIEAHGGRIWVESAVGEGTTVYFNLPLSINRLDRNTADA